MVNVFIVKNMALLLIGMFVGRFLRYMYRLEARKRNLSIMTEASIVNSLPSL